ncbi:hypothetical protein ACGFI9_07085 [Micromonospora sp. NPDC048930]|uniref:hypothetical protein n=1 Tax=Micromonospora sp. NPDC048930 TaxID=3364261 RepID=UPI003722A813
MSLPGPAVASAQPHRDGLWSRRLLALAAGGAVAGMAARVLLTRSPADLADVHGLVWAVTGVHLAQQRWRPRRTGRLVWRARVHGRHGTEPGLVAGRSAAGWVELVIEAALAVTLTVAGISLLPEGWAWVGVGRPVLLAGVALGLGALVYQEVRFTGRLALTASGIRDGAEWYPWSEVREARPNSRGRRDGVWLRLDPGRLWPQVVGGREVTVPDERLLAAIEQFRTRPEMLAVGLPVTPPEPAGA